MTRKNLFKQIKEQQKIIATRIRKLKDSRKIDKRNGRQLYSIESDIWQLKYEFRHRHIASCEMRGRTRDQIEKPREGNQASQREIDSYKQDWKDKIDEDVCARAA